MTKLRGSNLGLKTSVRFGNATKAAERQTHRSIRRSLDHETAEAPDSGSAAPDSPGEEAAIALVLARADDIRKTAK
jgi:hypothetical protein